MNTILVLVLFFILTILFWALFGGREEKAISLKRSEDDTEKDAIRDEVLRRRSADKDIEERFPGEIAEKSRRASDPDPSFKESSLDNFKIPFTADEIISKASRFAFYRRTLLNSEIYGAKGEFSTAISLYEGVNARIADEKVKFKIKTNIDYLENFKKKKNEVIRKKVLGETQPKQDEVKFKIDGNLPNTITIGVVDQTKGFDQEALIEKITARLKNEIDGLKNLQLPENKDSDDFNRLNNEIDNLKNKISSLGESSGKEDISRLMNNINDLSSQIKNLDNLAEKLKEPEYKTAEKEPELVEAKFESGKMQEILDRLSKITPQSGEPEYKKPRQEKKEELIQKKEIDSESDSDFELLQEYGKDKDFEDKLSDEEIFEKILKDDKKEDDQSFEILGNKKDDSSEFLNLSSNIDDTKRKEEQDFYKNLIKSDKRLKKELPILKVSYNFNRLPEELSLSKDKNIIEYSFYKYKSLLQKADEYVKKRKLRDAMNYYKMILNQNIPPEFKNMIRKNISDLNEYLEKYLASD